MNSSKKNIEIKKSEWIFLVVNFCEYLVFKTTVNFFFFHKKKSLKITRSAIKLTGGQCTHVPELLGAA